jgi:hypothetical protein
MKKGFQRVKVDGQYYEIADVPPLDKKYKHDIDIVVDRIVVRSDIAARLADSLETCLRLAEGLAIAEFADKPLPDAETSAGGSANKSLNETHERMLFSEKFACPVSGFTIPEIEPRLFSFNNPHGACPTCDGLGTQKTIRRGADCPRAEPDPARWRHRALGQVEFALLHCRRSKPSRAFRLQAVRPLERPARSRAECHPARHRRERSPSATTTAARPTHLKHFRGRDPQHGAPLPRDRQRLDPRGIRALPEQPPLRRLRRLPPAARGAGGEDRGPACREVVQMSIREALPGAKACPPAQPSRRTRSPARS